MSQPVYYLRECHLCGVWRRINLILFGDASVDFEIPHFGLLFPTQIEDDRGHKATVLVIRRDQNVLLDNIFIMLHHGLLYYYQPCHCTASVEHLELDWMIEQTNPIQGITPESPYIWVQHTDSDLNNTFQGQVPSVPVLHCTRTQLNQILQCQEHLPTGKTILT